MYEDKDSFCGYQFVSVKSVRYEALPFAYLTVNKVSWVQDRVASCCLVSLAVGSLTIAKFMDLS